jgi:hypothetical protein
MNSGSSAPIIVVLLGIGLLGYLLWDVDLDAMRSAADDSPTIYCEIDDTLVETDYTLNRLIEDIAQVYGPPETDRVSFIRFEGKRKSPFGDCTLHLRQIGQDRIVVDRISQDGAEEGHASAKSLAGSALPGVSINSSFAIQPTVKAFFALLFVQTTARRMAEEMGGRCSAGLPAETRKIELPEWLRDPTPAR